MDFLTQVTRNLPRVVVLERDDSLAKTLQAAAQQANAITIERAGTIDTALKTIERVGSNAVLGTMDFASAEIRRFIATLRNPKRTPAPHIVIVALTPTLSRRQVVAVIRMGVNQLVVPPHTTERVRDRVLAAWQGPSINIAAPEYIGPCRRRAPDDVYEGPRRRGTEQGEDLVSA